MQITIDFDEDILQPAIKNHLETGESVQSYIEHGCKILTELLHLKNKGRAIIHCIPKQNDTMLNVGVRPYDLTDMQELKF
jgi:hypothetical protein